jgi:hypothetical protein
VCQKRSFKRTLFYDRFGAHEKTANSPTGSLIRVMVKGQGNCQKCRESGLSKQMTPNPESRSLSVAELQLARWMLENGTDEAFGYLKQLKLAKATLWHCQCGCASFNFKIENKPLAPSGVHVLGDFLMGDESSLAGAFIFDKRRNPKWSGVVRPCQ